MLSLILVNGSWDEKRITSSWNLTISVDYIGGAG